MIHKFEAFNINIIPRSQNSNEDILANATSKLVPTEGFKLDKFYVELIYRPSILNNITRCGVFDDEQQIIDFMHSEDTFRRSIIDDEKHVDSLHASRSRDELDRENKIPKSIVSLEKLFDL